MLLSGSHESFLAATWPCFLLLLGACGCCGCCAGAGAGAVLMTDALMSSKPEMTSTIPSAQRSVMRSANRRWPRRPCGCSDNTVSAYMGRWPDHSVVCEVLGC